MVHCSSLFLVSELLVAGITCGDSVTGEVACTSFLSQSWQIAFENFPTVASLLLSNVSRVRVASNEHSCEEQDHIAISTIVESVGLVPVWELSGVLVSQRGNISHLLITLSTANIVKQISNLV